PGLIYSVPPAPTPRISTPSLHDALPIFGAVALRPVGLLADDDAQRRGAAVHVVELGGTDELVALVEDAEGLPVVPLGVGLEQALDRKSTRLNSSHVKTSYAVFCLKKKNR